MSEVFGFCKCVARVILDFATMAVAPEAAAPTGSCFLGVQLLQSSRCIFRFMRSDIASESYASLAVLVLYATFFAGCAGLGAKLGRALAG